jgi:exopolyphosphatase / guanosine-5'-triphosphate,3'-diphosphate pyrophosphatase
VSVRAAVWDLGSSSFHLLVCDALPDGTLHPVLRRRALLNLGASVGATGTIPADRVSAALAAVRRLRRQLDVVRPELSVALATAALRDAENGPDVVARLERVIGEPVRVLDGAEEARLCFTGQRSGVWTPARGEVLGIDLGGGSLELAVGTHRAVEVALSVPIGATRLRGELDSGEVLTPAERSLVRDRTTGSLGEVRQLLADRETPTARTVASGGTARALARIATARARRPGESSSAQVGQVELPAAQVAEMADRLASLPLEDRLRLPGMPARRAPVLPLGAVVLATTAEILGIDHYVVSEWGLREGALIDALANA